MRFAERLLLSGAVQNIAVEGVRRRSEGIRIEEVVPTTYRVRIRC